MLISHDPQGLELLGCHLNIPVWIDFISFHNLLPGNKANSLIPLFIDDR